MTESDKKTLGNKVKPGAPVAAPTKQSQPEEPELTTGELKEQLQTIEAEVVELEKKAKRVAMLREENKIFKKRMSDLQSALWGLLYYSAHPSEEELLKKRLQTLTAAFKALPKMATKEGGDPTADES